VTDCRSSYRPYMADVLFCPFPKPKTPQEENCSSWIKACGLCSCKFCPFPKLKIPPEENCSSWIKACGLCSCKFCPFPKPKTPPEENCSSWIKACGLCSCKFNSFNTFAVTTHVYRGVRPQATCLINAFKMRENGASSTKSDPLCGVHVGPIL